MIPLTLKDIEDIEILSKDALAHNCKDSMHLLVEECLPRLIADSRRLRNEMALISKLCNMHEK